MRAWNLTAALCLLVTASAAAGPCGDDVDGRLVPCDCGDVLVGSRTLDERDPITQRTCTGTGLLVAVPPGRPAPTLALGGHALAGSGHGVGIQVTAGGDGGLDLVGPGVVRGFALGVLAPAGTLMQATDIVATANRTDGFRVAGDGFAIRNCQAERNGSDGFALRGREFQLEGNRAIDNGRHGFSIGGRAAQVGETLGNEAAANRGSGIVVRGRGHALVRPAATANRGTGIRVQGAGSRVAAPVASSNGGTGLRGAGAGLTVVDPAARDNGGDDLDVRGLGACAGSGCR